MDLLIMSIELLDAFGLNSTHEGKSSIAPNACSDAFCASDHTHTSPHLLDAAQYCPLLLIASPLMASKASVKKVGSALGHTTMSDTSFFYFNIFPFLCPF